MDPLSACASILAVLQTASALAKRIRGLRDVPRAIHTISNEIADFELVLRAVEFAVTERQAFATSAKDTFDVIALSSLLDRAKGELDRLERILSPVIGQPSTNPAEITSRMLWWVREKRHVDILRQGLARITASLSIILTASISVSERTKEIPVGKFLESSKAGLLEIPKDINEPSGDPADSVAHSQRRVFPEPQEKRTLIPQSRNVDEIAISRDCSRINDSTLANSPYRSKTWISAEHTDRWNLLQATVADLKCAEVCCCVCHKSDRLSSPPSTTWLFGSFSIDYTADLISKTACNERSCSRQRFSAVRITYRFPHWLLNRVIKILLLNAASCGPMMTIKTLRVVSDECSAFRLARKGDLDGIKSLFSNGLASPYDVDSANQSLLDMAFNRNHMELCSFLVTAGVDPFIEDLTGWSVISDAWEYAHQRPETAHSKLTVWRTSDVERVSDEQQLPMITKIVLGYAKIDLQSFLDVSTSTINDVDRFGRTALYWAASRGDEASVCTLLKFGANLSLSEQTGLTPLHVADTARVITILLQFGANINARDRWDRTPLHWACYQGKSVEVVQALLDGGADCNARRRDSSGAEVCAIHMAADIGSVALTECLLNSGALINSQTQPEKLTALSIAASRDNAELVQFLLSRGVDHGFVNSSGQTILHIAAECCNIETLNVIANAKLTGVPVGAYNANQQTACRVFSSRGTKTDELERAFDRLLKSVQPEILQSAADSYHCENLQTLGFQEDGHTDMISNMMRGCPGSFD